MTTEEIKNQSAIILQQLGGMNFYAMTGAKYMSFDSAKNTPNLSFRFAGTKINHCQITLDQDDTYSVIFYKIRGTKCHVVSEYTMIYADALQALFTRVTGLDTRL